MAARRTSSKGSGAIVLPGPASTLHRPNADLSLLVSFGDPVAIRVDKTVHYLLEWDEGKTELYALIPRGGHTVILRVPDPWRSDKPVNHTVMLLNIHNSNNSREPPSQLANHCMNYLRQSILRNINARGKHSVKPQGNTERCRGLSGLGKAV